MLDPRVTVCFVCFVQGSRLIKIQEGLASGVSFTAVIEKLKTDNVKFNVMLKEVNDYACSMLKLRQTADEETS